MRALALIGMVMVAGCNVLLPSVTALLRGAGGLTATCTGDPRPTVEDCRAQGEQAWIELSTPNDGVTRIDVLFGPVTNGCRAVTWTAGYASGDRVRQPTEVCGGS